MAEENEEGFKWENRRKSVALSYGVCIIGLIYVLIAVPILGIPLSENVQSTAVTWFCIQFGATVGAHAFGASWENTTIAKTRPPRRSKNTPV